MKDFKFIKGFLLGILLMLVIGVGGYLVYENADTIFGKNSVVTPDSRSAKQKVELLDELIDGNYLDKVNDDKLTEGMYAGLISGLGDPYSRYFTKEEYESQEEDSEGEYFGIGVVMSQDPETKSVTVVRCYEGAPGAEAGILPGDIIYKIDDTEVTNMELTDVAKLIRKQGSDTAHMTLVREGEADYIKLEVKKSNVEVPSVAYEMLDNQVGYIAIYEFQGVTAQQYHAAFQDLESQGMKKLVVDLRGNPGGLLDSVCDILNTMLPEGLIVYTEDKNGNREEYKSDGGTPISIPMSVLVDGNSASAAEIFAGAVQDYQVGTLVGTTTYGKGIVQKIIPLTDGSAVKLTIANYYTPKGRNIHKKGITPDLEIELEESLKQKVSISKEEDNQLQKALEVLGK